MADTEIPIIAVYSDNFSPLYQRWAQTLPAGFKPYVKLITIQNDGYGFQKGSWYNAIAQKTDHAINTLASFPDQQLCVVSDVDIFFTKKTRDLVDFLQQAMKESPLDFLFMRENKAEACNAGFYCVRNSASVRQTLVEAREFCRKGTKLGDQSYFNGPNFTLKRDYIPNRLVAWGTEIHNRQHTLLHHAVCVGTLQEKLKQQQNVAARLGLVL